MAFNTLQARELVEYIDLQYGREPEHLWQRSPEDAIFRRGDNQKWFAGIFHVRRNKVEPNAGDEVVEILDIRCAPDMIDFIVDKQKIFPGWHMNKRHWITIILDGRMPMRQIKQLLDASFELAVK